MFFDTFFVDSEPEFGNTKFSIYSDSQKKISRAVMVKGWHPAGLPQPSPDATECDLRRVKRQKRVMYQRGLTTPLFRGRLTGDSEKVCLYGITQLSRYERLNPYPRASHNYNREGGYMT